MGCSGEKTSTVANRVGRAGGRSRARSERDQQRWGRWSGLQETMLDWSASRRTENRRPSAFPLLRRLRRSKIGYNLSQIAPSVR